MSPKTVIKLMCWGESVENNEKNAFTYMCPVLDAGLPFKIQKKHRDNSRRTRFEPPKELRNLPYWRDISPARTYSPKRFHGSSRKFMSVLRNISIQNSRKSPDLSYDRFRKMQQETERLEREISEIERFADLLNLEDDYGELSQKRLVSVSKSQI